MKQKPTNPRDVLQLSLAQERERIVNKLWQIRQDMDSFNENEKPADPIVFVFDFTSDLDEREAARRAQAAE